MKKILAILLAAVLAAGLFAGCSGDSASSGSEYDQVVYAYATFNNIPTEEALDEVEEAINVITREKIGAEITLKPIAIADYSQSVSLSLQGGEKIDIMESIGDFNNYLSTSMALDITELIDTYAPETKELVGEDWLAACEYQGALSGIPDYKPLALTPMIIYRQDVVDELGLDMDSVTCIEDLSDIFAQIKEAKPDMTPLAIVETGNVGVFNLPYGVDYLSDDYNQPVGVLIGDDMTVQDFYSTDLFLEKANLVRDWYNNGYVMKDAATTTSTSTELMASGNYFG